MRNYTVKEFTDELKSIITATYDELISIKGEVTDLTHSMAGHIYFKLKDSGAVLNVAYFKNYNISRNAFIPKHGDLVSVMGMINLYESDGLYNLVARKIIYSSVGDIYQRFIETKNRLEAEGLFESSRKRSISKYPSKIAVATSLQAAALKDFIATSRRLNAKFDIDIYPIPVQGMQGRQEIIRVLLAIDQLSSEYDLLLITRGGGSLEDLSLFNDEEIARVIAGLKIPVISAIGHERDFLISDFVADLRASTPTAAAEILSSGYNSAYKDIGVYTQKIGDRLRNRLDRYSYKIDRFDTVLRSRTPELIIDRYRTKISFLESSSRNTILLALNSYRNRFAYIVDRLDNYQPSKTVSNLIDQVESIDGKLKTLLTEIIKSNLTKIMVLETKLKLLDPYNVLNRGYAIVSKDDLVVNAKTEISAGDILDIQLKTQNIKTRVLSKEKL